MNIHFKDKKIFNSLNNNSIGSFLVGSHLYGTNTKNSDTDYLIIYLNKTYSYLWENHQLQYKGDNTDYNFVELRTFIRNLLTGDSTINLELLFSNQLEKTKLDFLLDFKKDFVNYNIIRSYLGQARRDLKKYNSTNDMKKLAHTFRGYNFASQLFENNNLDIKMETKLLNGVQYDRDIYSDILNGEKLSKSLLKSLISELRDKVNKAFEYKQLHRMMSVERLKELDNKIKEFYKSHAKGILEIDFDDIFYNVLENGIKY